MEPRQETYHLRVTRQENLKMALTKMMTRKLLINISNSSTITKPPPRLLSTRVTALHLLGLVVWLMTSAIALT